MTSQDADPSPSPAIQQRQLAALEAFARAYLKERRSERRWRVLVRVGWLALGLAVVWGITRSSLHTSQTNKPHTALVEVRGEISSESEASAEIINTALRDAFKDEGSRAVVLRINSPGGSPVQAGLINDEIKRLRAQYDKPVYAVCEEMCASAAYYLAVAADEVYVNKATIVGSIGVLMDGFGFNQVLDKLGVERRLLTAGSNKGMLDPFSPMKEQDKTHAQALLDQIHEQFIAVVREGRGERLKETAETFSGLFWNGQASLEQGLADKLGSLDSVAREVVKAEDVIDYTPRENVAERLVKRFGASIGAGAARALRAMPTLQ